MAKTPDTISKAAKVWDLPVRLFHWCQALLFVALWASVEWGEMEWHLWFAYCLMTLWLSRILWGFVGSDTARFRQFVRSPFAAWRYLRGEPHEQPGHNPAGGWMVLLLLTLVALQFTSGLFTTDDIFTEGPLYSLVSDEVSSFMGWWHEVNFNLLLGAVAIHLLAVFTYEVRGERLLLPMFTGMSRQVSESAVIRGSALWWIILCSIGAGLYWWWQPALPW